MKKQPLRPRRLSKKNTSKKTFASPASRAKRTAAGKGNEPTIPTTPNGGARAALSSTAPSSPPAEAAEPADRLILRPEAARLAGFSVPTLRRYEKTTLKPILVDKSGVHWHSLRVIEEFANQLRSTARPERTDSNDGATSAAAFELFDAGSNAADVVKTLKIVSADARALQKEWADLRGAMLISGETLSKIRRLRTTNDNPILTGEELLLFIEGNELLTCKVCPRQPVFCMVCYQCRPRKAEAMVALAQRQAEEREAALQREWLERETYHQARESAAYDPAAGAAARAEREARIAARRAARQQQRPPPAGQTTERPLNPRTARSRGRAATATTSPMPSRVPGGGAAGSASGAEPFDTAAPARESKGAADHERSPAAAADVASDFGDASALARDGSANSYAELDPNDPEFLTKLALADRREAEYLKALLARSPLTAAERAAFANDRFANDRRDAKAGAETGAGGTTGGNSGASAKPVDAGDGLPAGLRPTDTT